MQKPIAYYASAYSLGATRLSALCLILCCFILINNPAEAQSNLKSYRVSSNSISVSGFSSGAFFAHQFHIAYSKKIMGAGIIAGGPYHCVTGQQPFDIWRSLKKCMTFGGIGLVEPRPDIFSSESLITGFAKSKHIDDPKYLKNDNVYLLSGTQDLTVPQSVMNAVRDLYQMYIKADQIEYVNYLFAGHAIPAKGYGTKNCNASRSPFINDCNYDSAGELFKRIYGVLQPAVTANPDNLLSFAQQGFSKDPGAVSLSEKGHIYVPSACQQKQACRLHIAFHGCLQYEEIVNDAFYSKAGYNDWAESNKIIVLYPQVQPQQSLSKVSMNPRGCWDWWGYTGQYYATKKGPQMQAINAMIERITNTNN